MLQKWKHIISNWINCYFDESNQDERSVNIESLINIISHLHENLNLDESKSSILEAHTVEGFVLEKYPEFKFENGTVEASNEDEVYLVASLLLLFVCVNSKDVDIKSAMCSKLSGDDQETILKFSKSLLDCSPITRRDVQAAITDACDEDMASSHVKVAETPPALRSLHGEVRRLQAALDAERFDRNYLQEELARTNLRLEKLTKDKEQYKLDIVNLKAKLSLCGAQEQESRGAEAEAEAAGKLQRQLQDLEERLVRTQELLDDAVYERDTYKTKVDELKQDRDKWLSLSQRESDRAAELSEELEAERRHAHSLKELVNELRQHNRRNGLDSSQLECDDPDASIQSLTHNISVCSEACANVVEVQLGEEKAKVEALKQQLQRLEHDMNELNQKTEKDKQNYEKQISERDSDILDLKHRFNEEVEEKNNLKSQYNDDISKLNNEINELEQKIKDNNDNSRMMIENKMQEIKTLQEEKLSLLQSLTNETTKLENIITGLKAELETEKQARLAMRDSYENQMMKLNEKVLNRNNELVELQNSIFEKGEMIETLQMDLRNEKEISNKYHINVRQLSEQKREVENKLQDKNDEMNAMQKSLEHNISTVLKEADHFKNLVSSLQDHCRELEQCKTQLDGEIKKQATRFEELLKDMDNLKNTYNEETKKLKFDLDEKNAIINSLQTQLQDEIHHKIGYQEELQRLQAAKLHLSEELNKLNVECSKVKIEVTGKERTIESLDLCLKEARDTNDKLKSDNEKLNQELMKMSNEITHKNNSIEILNSTFETTKKSLEEQLSAQAETIDYNNHKIATLTGKKKSLQSQIEVINTEKAKLENDIVAKNKQISQLQAECEKLTKTIDENKKAIRSLDQNMTKEKQKYSALETTCNSEMSKIMGKLSDTEKTIKELSSNSRKSIKNKDHQIHTLNNEIENLKRALDIDRENISLINKERDALTQKLNDEISFKNKIEKEYQNQCSNLENVTSLLNEEISDKNREIAKLKMEHELAMKTIEGKCKEIRLLGERLSKEDQLVRDIAHQKTVETKDLQKKINELQSLNHDLEQEVKQANDCKKQTIEAMRKENEQLHFAIEEDNSNHEVLVKEKDCIIDKLEQQFKEQTVQLESIRKDYENITLTLEIYKVETKQSIEAKEELVSKLTHEVAAMQRTLADLRNERDLLSKNLETMAQQMKEAENKNREEVVKLVETLNHEEITNAVSMKEKELLQNQLTEEKAARDSLQTEKEHQNEEIKVLVADKKELLNEKVILTQQIAEERSVRRIYEEERNALASQTTALEKKLLKQVAATETLLENKECLTQQLVEEKSAKELAEKEKENLLMEKHLIEQKIIEVENNKEEMSKEIDHLIEKHCLLDKQCVIEREANEVLRGEKLQLIQNLTAEKSSNEVLLKQNKTLTSQNESLKQDLHEIKTIQEVLVADKELLMSEKEGLVKSLGVEKSAHDEIETEKDQLITKLCELNENYKSKVDIVQTELEKVTQDMNSLQIDFKKQEEINTQITTALNIGLEKLVKGLQKEGIANEALQKILQSDNRYKASDKCETLMNIADVLTTELVMRHNLEKALEHGNSSLAELTEKLKQKEMLLLELQAEVKRLQQVVSDNKIEFTKQNESYNATIEKQAREMHVLQQENQSLTNDLNDVKLQLELKVHSLKEKLIDNEDLTDKLKSTYECQLDNLNVMITKLTNYLKDKSLELETVRKEKDRVLQTVEEKCEVIKGLEEEVKAEVQKQQKLIKDFESERQILKNMVTVTESIMEDQKVTLNNVVAEHARANEVLQEENKNINELLENKKKDFETKLQEKDATLETLFKELAEVRLEKDKIEKEVSVEKGELGNEVKNLETKLIEKERELESVYQEIAELRRDKDLKQIKENLVSGIKEIISELQKKTVELKQLQDDKITLECTIQKYKHDMVSLEKRNSDLQLKEAAVDTQLRTEIDNLNKALQEQTETNTNLELTLKEKTDIIKETEEKAKLLQEQVNVFEQDKNTLEEEKIVLLTDVNEFKTKVSHLDTTISAQKEETAKLNNEKQTLVKIIEENKNEISKLEQLLKEAQEQHKKLGDDVSHDKLYLNNKCAILQEYHDKAEIQLEERQKEIVILQKELDTLRAKVKLCEEESKAKDAIVSKISKEKDVVIGSITKELQDEKAAKDVCEREIEEKTKIIKSLKQNLEEMNIEREALHILKKENAELIKAIGHRDTFAAAQSQERTSSHKHSGHAEKEHRDLQHQVDNTSSDMTHSSTESLKTISDLEKIIQDKNRTITTLNSDVTYLKTLMAESETKLLDVTKELEVSKENCHQLSTQLKKLVQQKNDEIADLKKQVNKMSVTENRATQIIKVSAKYQAIILKRIAEIKTNTVLKELTNFGNSNYDSEVKRSLSAGTITMEDLENFLETTDRHLRKCSEKQVALQKERDRLAEVNRINESEIINLKKFLTELSASFQAFSAVKETYTQKLSKVVSVQRTVRREVLSLQGQLSAAAMCTLERGYAAAAQDLAECALSLQRWHERCVARTVSAERLQHAFLSDSARASLAGASFHNAALDVQLDELDATFQRLLGDAARAARGEGRDDTQLTVMEVRAEYEDKLNRMKSKMKQLYTEQIAAYKDKQRAEVAALERELAAARARLAESARAYEQHIRGLTSELWSVGERLLLQRDEADWLRRKQRSGSLMSLQHVHSSGLVPFQEEPARPSDSHSLRSLPVNNNATRREGRGLHMSDEEGEVFDNRWLKELAATPRRESAVSGHRKSSVSGHRESGAPGQRLSELRWRNSLCPPHLKSSYPAETQFTHAVDEEDIKCIGLAGAETKPQRKEVGITAYKKPGPPTPSKQAGRLSATDSELRESLRVEAEPQPSRKTSTPSRIRSLFRSSKNDTAEGTPRSRRLSNIFRKK
ncbi:golgin subfamily B member 1-like isoform X1 [Helicoverpa zea]|uniref:golgin subfamily B member 1-like isoform X1 n=2 Tax=Helicoverpa zea TaxID=7113 RepID=UPI001F56F712|nr:golgin subfamily B member 1-like isoform X1 [Helicoverpa zea]